MNSQNLQALDFLVHTLQAGQPAWLVTLLSIWGSAPRPAGSLLAVGPEQHCGSLSGGCLEETLLEELRTGVYDRQHPHTLRIGVSQEQARQYRLPCGGQMQLLLEPISPDTPAQEAYESLRTLLNKRQSCLRQVDTLTGHVTLHPSSPPSSNAAVEVSESQVRHHLGPNRRLLLVGANLVADQLATLADALEMEVWVCDPRADAFSGWPHAFTRNCAEFPDDLIREHFQNEHDVIITLAHDPRVDDMALMEALNTQVAYVGALGSRQTTQTRLQRLRELGIGEDQLTRLRAPVGLDIGSKTPVEIAIAIAAELIALRSGRLPQPPLRG